MADSEQAPQQLAVAIIPSPGMGHLIPLVQFAILLSSRFPSLSVSLLIPSASTSGPAPPRPGILGSLPPSVSCTFLPPVDPALLPESPAPVVAVTRTHSLAVPSVRAELGLLSRRARVVAVVTDLFGTEMFGVAREMGVPPYMYFTTNAMFLLFMRHLPVLDRTVSCEYRDMVEPLVLPGCVPLQGKDFTDPVQDRKDLGYRVILEHAERYVQAEGIFVNTFTELETGAIHALQQDPNLPPVYPIGPIIQSGQPDSDASKLDCLKWLDQQPLGSVLFVSFGSGGTLSAKQLSELALGLEKSGHRFLWVVRSPNDDTSHGSYFGDQSKKDPNDLFGSFLPPGFVSRVKDRGLLVHSWAPQAKILAHGSIGGFLTHCGWNSILESIVNGVPLIAWPLYAEQRTNAVMLAEGLKVALRPKASQNGVVEADEIGKVVKELMEGEVGWSVKRKMKELSELAERATSEDGGSTKLLSEVVGKWLQCN